MRLFALAYILFNITIWLYVGGNDLTHFYRVLADETRRKILALTAQREYTQAELVSLFDVSQPAIKKHLDLLLQEQLLHERKEGRYRYYKLHLDNFKDKKSRG